MPGLVSHYTCRLSTTVTVPPLLVSSHTTEWDTDETIPSLLSLRVCTVVFASGSHGAFKARALGPKVTTRVSLGLPRGPVQTVLSALQDAIGAAAARRALQLRGLLRSSDSGPRHPSTATRRRLAAAPLQAARPYPHSECNPAGLLSCRRARLPA